MPQCELVTCPPLEVTSPHLRLLSLNNSYLGAATFSCPLGYTLSPAIPSIWCGHTGAWSAPLPSCQLVRSVEILLDTSVKLTPSLIRCEVPEAPVHGSLVTSGDNTVGSTISLACSDGFILMGETIIRCGLTIILTFVLHNDCPQVHRVRGLVSPDPLLQAGLQVPRAQRQCRHYSAQVQVSAS